MMDADTIIDQVLTRLKEPTDGTAHWARADVLARLNMSQDEIATVIPDLLRAEDTSLTTTGTNSAYTIPATVGKVYQVRVSGSPIYQSSENALNQANLRGEIDDMWRSTTGSDAICWFVRNNSLFLYPTPPSGSIITIIGEIMLTQMTDASSSYPFENVPYLRKGQKILIFLTAADLAQEDGDMNLYQSYKQEAYSLLESLKKDWMILRTVDPTAMPFEQTSENHQ